ncbi:MAG: cation-translocating P-type ATPase [Vulcanococcus sp.]
MGNDSQRRPIPWHALPEAAVLGELASSWQGLSEPEAARRLAVAGPNRLPQPEVPGLLPLLLRQFRSPLIAVLVAAALLSLAVGDLKDAGFIGAVLLLNALVGGVQEWQAERRSHALRQLLKVQALVLRGGEAVQRDAETLVPGDVVALESGQVVPADLRLQRCHGLEVDESLLTGESLPVHKHADAALEPDTPLAERSSMAFAGATVVRGRGLGMVVATARATEVGRLAADLQALPPGRPPLLQRLDRFSRTIGVVVVLAALLVGWLAMVRGGIDHLEALVFAIALAVSAIPEGLPVALTVALAVASHRMAQRQVIVRRLPAVEGLGSCTLIASDKTGTLTCNRLSVCQVWLADGRRLSLDGTALAPAEHGALQPLARIAVLCNEADLQARDGGWDAHGDPTDLALLHFGHQLGCTRTTALLAEPQCNAIPFEPEHRFAASFHTPACGGTRVVVKGAPERVLPMCRMAAEAAQEWAAATAALAAQGLRVLALAEGELPAALGEQATPPEPSQLRWAGLLGLMDPLRPGAQAAIQRCIGAGIRVWMITGDHPTTAAAIAMELGLIEGPEEVVEGRTLEQASPRQLQRLAESRCIFARMAPHQKLQLVQAAQQAGHFVAVTGDGVNDAPALRAAQIGIAMGRSGTDVAREAADLVLADDDFASIVAGVEEGRIAYANVRKVIALLVSSGAAEIVLIALAVGSGLPLPLLPVQLLWLNLVTNGIQDVALAFEPAEGDVLRRRPRPPAEPVFDRLMRRRTLLSALVMGLVAFGLYALLLQRGWPLEAARNALLLQMVLFENVQIGNCRLEHQSVFRCSPLRVPILLTGTLAAFGVHVLMMHLPIGAQLLGTGPLPLGQWLVELALSLTVLLAVEVQKALERRAASAILG